MEQISIWLKEATPLELFMGVIIVSVLIRAVYEILTNK